MYMSDVRVEVWFEHMLAEFAMVMQKPILDGAMVLASSAAGSHVWRGQCIVRNHW